MSVRAKTKMERKVQAQKNPFSKNLQNALETSWTTQSSKNLKKNKNKGIEQSAEVVF
jgi:hypothetical protein